MSVFEAGNHCGYMVVRKPQHNIINREFLEHPIPPPRVGDIYYCGFERQGWEEIDAGYNNHTLPDDVRLKRSYIRELEQNRLKLCSLDLCPDLEIAIDLLDYSNREGEINELIAVYSDYLAETSETVCIEPARLAWLGYDLMGWDVGSLLARGYFKLPELFAGWESTLNGGGLFSWVDPIEEYVRAYQAAAEADTRIEPIFDLGISIIEVATVSL